MQPPPQAGAGGPPPPATSRHMYWRNGPLGRRPNAPVSAAPGPVQPVRDPFAFGRQPPQGSPLGHATKGDPPLAPGFPPMAFPPPALPHAPQSHSGENSRSTDLCLPAPASQPGGSRAAPSAAAPPLSSPAHRTNSTEAHSGVEHGAHSPVGQTGCTGATLENSLWGPQGSASMPDRPVSGQEMNRNAGHACSTPTPLPVIPPGQQMVPQWMPAQSSSQPQAHAFSPYSEPLSQNAFYAQSTLGISQPAPHMTPQQSPAQPSVVQNATQAPLILGDASSAAASQQSPWRNVGGASPWPVQLPQEHFYLQPLEASHPSSNAAAQENSPLASNRSLSETAGGHCPADMDAGTISMFFKGDEAENEEILSSELTEQTGKADSDAFQQTMGHTYYQPLHAHQVPAAPFPPAQASLAEVLPKDAQQSFRTRAMQQDTQADPAFAHEDRAGLTEPGNRGGPQYENVENQECVQNQEVLPNEPLARSCPSPGAVDASRYASLLGPSLSKTGHVTPLEGGPNLEAPDASPRPTRPDSVSSSYSGLSHRSASGSAWPQELGTFIQQERGRPEAEPSLGFFQQIDSSPLGGGAADHNPGKSYHRSLSQAPTPSPPKPMGVFQTSANSSFEPVRSHGLGIRPPEADQAKVVAELRENCPGPRSTKKTPPSFVSPGNLEQPPDNLETCFLPQSHPLPLTIAGTAGNALQAVGGAVMENMPSAPEKRALARAQGVAKKCESPATTLWAHSELPNFGGNVLLAPAAPTVYVPAKPAAVHVVQPPEEGLPEPQTGQPGSAPAALPPAANVSSENLENPPKMGDEETGCSQASSGYASLLSSPPTEALQNQPVLIAQPPSCSLAQPLSFSLATQLSRSEKDPSVKDPGISSKPLLGVHGSGNPPGENTLSPSPLVHAPAAPALSNTNLPQGPPSASERTCGPPPNSLAEPASQGPLDLAPESKRGTGLEGLPPECASQPRAAPSGARGGAAVGVGSLGPVGGTSHRSKSNSDGQEPPRALDFAAAKPPEPGGLGSYTQGPSSSFTNQWGGPHLPGHMAPSAPGAPGPQHFYPQVTKDRQSPMPLDRATSLQHPAQTALPSQGMAPQLLPASSNPPALPGNSPTQAASQRLCPAGPSEANSAQLPASCAQAPAHDKQAAPGPPPASTALSAGQPARPPSQQEQAPPQPSQNAFVPPPNPYYYYRNPFDAYSSAYAPPYPPMDPRTAHLYYQDMYGQYDPSYQQYENAAAYPGSYRHVEPERPSSRASHTSDRPPSRQGYPEDYYNPKSGWNEYYTDYYAPSYADSSRYQTMYDAWYRDQRYWYDLEQNPYQKREPYALRNSHDHHDDYWHYDPRYVGGFEDELDSRRDPYGDDFDRRSIHSEHSGHSLHSSHSIHSRHSSFSSRSQQSQLYRSNHDPAASGYDTDPQPPSLHADYASGRYAQYASPPSLTGYNHAAWPAAEQVPSRPLTPEKFSVPHVCARFGPGGYLIKVLPNLPSEGQPALVEVHSMEMMMQHSSEQEEMRKFPGPLIKDETHKVDVINFAQSQATRCMQNEMLIDKESARLLWDFVVLLCRQNGTVVGTDIAELLLQEHKTAWLPGKPPVEANLIDFTSEAVEQAEESGEAQLSCLTGSLTAATDSLEKETERFRELLLYGRKKDALESAMKHGLWGHALLLASKMDSRTHARVMTRFANSLPINDPLQTVYQLMSGRMPAASTCCGDEKWGDWRPHLAMVLSNLTNNTDVESRTIITMGDTLVSKGLLDAAHFCYLMARVGFGVYTKKTAKLVLIGSNHSLPFLKFATNEAIQRTEAYEYAQSLGTQPCCLPSFQVFKFLYACRLAEMGLSAQAFHYCEVIARTILRNPHCYSPVLIGQVIQISSRLRLFDPQNKEKPEQELFIEPDWLLQLRILDGQIKEGALTYHTDRSTPQQHACCSPGSEVGRISPNEGTGPSQEMNSGPDNPLFASLLPPNMGHPVQSVQLMPSAPQAILDSSATTASSPHQESAGPVPFYPTAPTSVGPGTGFPNPYAAEHSPVYPGTMPPPAGLTPEAIQLQPQEQFNQEAAAQCSLPESPSWKSVPEPREDDFYGRMASMGPGRQSRTTSQSSAHMAQGFGQRSRTTSESSVHSVGRERRNSAAQQPSPPPPSIPEGKETKQETRKEPAPQKSGTRWLSWLMGKGRNEAHLPDDKNKSIVWDEKKQRWVNLDEPEEESKPPPPPPTGFPQVPQATPSGPGGPPNATINMFSRRAAGNRSRYVDILNPSGAKPPGAAPAPSDLFAPLAPMPVPANLFVPNPGFPFPPRAPPNVSGHNSYKGFRQGLRSSAWRAPAVNISRADVVSALQPLKERTALEQQQPLEGAVPEEQVAPGKEPGPGAATDVPYLNSATFPPASELPPPNPEGSQSGELSRSSSMSSLSREVSQHFNQAPLGGPPTGAVQFYNPSHFAQPAAAPGSSRLSRMGQRKYPTLK